MTRTQQAPRADQAPASRPGNGGAPDPREALAALHGPGATLPGRTCPIASSLALVGEKWSLLALREVFLGQHRFTDIARGTGAPRDRLAARLRALVDAGVLEQREYSTSPARYGYHLTPAGRALAPVLRSLIDWGNTWVMDQPPLELRHGTADHPDHKFDASEVCRTCGEGVNGRDISIRTLTAG